MSYNKETGMYEGYIYCITNNVNDKQYVGQTRNDIATRWRGHKSNAKNSNGQKFAIHLAINKYGIENFSIRQIEKLKYSTLSELIEKLNETEKYYIEKYKTISPYGYNLTIGGEFGNIEDCKVVVQYDTFGNYISEYKSIVEAEIMTDGNHRAISACCKHYLKTSGGFVWEYKGNQPRIYGNIKKESVYKIDQYSLDGKFIKTYEHANLIEEELGIIASNIRSACTGYSKTASGFVWRKHGEPFDKYETRERIRFVGQNINQFDFEGNHICTYDEYTTLPDYVTNQSVVYECCRGKCKYAYGYIWTFGYDEPNLKDIPDSQKPLYKYDLDGNFIKKYKNVYEASEVLSIDKSGILNCIQGRNNSTNGFMWSTKYVNDMTTYKVKQAKGVDKYDYDGNFIANYTSIKSGTENSSIIKNRKTIENCCNGRIEYTRDGVWRYEGEPFEKYSLHKFCIIKNNEIIYSSVFQKDLATYLNVDFRLISDCLKRKNSYNGFSFKIIDVNKSA